ncbi:MAG: molybdopterin-guanine dinucleotide biosynthesis protein B, partial [Thermodesulfobacteriota bacterium]
MKVIAVMGAGRGSGKTTTVETLVEELTKRNYKVGTIKQIHEKDFSIDTPKKDTWRHAKAGARIVVSSAPHEISVIKKIDKEDRFKEAMHFLEGEDLDIIVVEGNPSVKAPRIFVARSPAMAKKVLGKIKEDICCIASLSPEKFREKEFEVPIYHSIKDIDKVISSIKEHLPRK